MSLVFVHPYPVPSPHAALIRAFRLATALATNGVAAEVWTGPGDRPVAECFRWAGVEPHPGVRWAPVFATATAAGPGRAASAELAVALAEHQGPAPTLLLRGDAGAALLVDRLQRRAEVRSGQVSSPGETLLHELHRPPGSLAPGDPTVPNRLRNRLAALVTPGIDLAAWAARAWGRQEGRSGLGLPWPGAARPDAVRLRRAIEEADGLVVVSEALATDLAEDFRIPPRCLVLPSGAPPATPVAATPAAADAGRDLEVVYVGKLEERKGVDVLLGAAAHLPGTGFRVVGGSPSQVTAWRCRALRLGLADRWQLPGFLPPAEMPALLARARVGVCPLPSGRDPVSDRYTSPLKLLEMMAAGVPVVATDVPPVTRLVRHGEEAWLVPPNDPVALAAAIQRILSDRGLAHRLSTAAARRAADHRWSERARDLDGFRRRVVSDRARAE